MLPPVQEDEEEDDDPYSEEHASKPLLSSSKQQQLQQSSKGKAASTHFKLKSSDSSAYSIAADTSMDTASGISSKPLRTKLKKTSKRASTP
jgi:beta-glucanase (GH16 family)